VLVGMGVEKTGAGVVTIGSGAPTVGLEVGMTVEKTGSGVRAVTPGAGCPAVDGPAAGRSQDMEAVGEGNEPGEGCAWTRAAG
jgi:hypothetical protein